MFRQTALPGQTWVRVAVKSAPMERFVAALAAWKEGEFARFQMVFQPGVDPREWCKALLAELEVLAREQHLSKALYGELLAEENEISSLLRAHGFKVWRSERFFRIDARRAEERVNHLLQGREIPAGWRTESIRHHAPETALHLVARHRLMTADELRRHWQAEPGHGFDLDFSNLIFEDGKPFGVLLARRSGDALFYDVRIVDHPNRLLRAVANLCLFRHNAIHEMAPQIRWLQFRGGESEHRETANLAVRMGGVELPVRHALVKELRSADAGTVTA